MTTGWTTAALGDCCEIISGSTPKTDVAAYWGGDVAWATPKDLSDLSRSNIAATPRNLTDQGLSSCGARILPPGSVLLSSRAPIGLVAINDVPMATNQGFKSLVPRSDRLFNRYLYWWLRTHVKEIQYLGRGATFKEISKEVTAAIKIPVPPLEEQKRIAAILDGAECVEHRCRCASELATTLVEEIYYEMFGDPEKTAIDEVPLIGLIDPKRPITYGILKPGPDVPNGVPYVRVADMKNGGIDFEGLRRTSPIISDQYRRSLLVRGDLLLSIRGHVGRLAEVAPEVDGANITQDSARLAVLGANPTYVLAFLRTPYAQRWMVRHTKGGAVQGINLTDVKRIPVPRFDRSRQDEFEVRARAADNAAALLRKSLSITGSLSQSLQQKAFAGQL